jgi:nucleotide-binding universal stress UspA family protein
MTHPLRLLLATDLSGRCDRALGRAAQLSRNWSVPLLVVHAVEPEPQTPRGRGANEHPARHRPEGRVEAAERLLHAELQADGIQAAVRVAEGQPATVLADAVLREQAGLVVCGLARDDGIDRVHLGSTVDVLLQDVVVPVLVVRRKARGPYRHVVVATDCSAASRAALQAALQWFAGGQLTVFHAFDAPGGGLPGDDTVNQNWRQVAEHHCRQFLADAGVTADEGARLRVVLELGHPEALLHDFVQREGADLVILGTHGRTGLMKAMLGSTAQALLHLLECDTMVVRGRPGGPQY